MKLKVVSLLLSCLVNGQYSSGDDGVDMLEESSTGTIFDEIVSTRRKFDETGAEDEEELILVEFDSATSVERRDQLNKNGSRGSTEQSTPTFTNGIGTTESVAATRAGSTTPTPEEENSNTMLVIGLAAGLGAVLVVTILTITTCCIMQKRREERRTKMAKRPVESNPVEQTFERVDFNRQSDSAPKEKNANPADQTISELAPSSMGTMRTFVQISNQKPVSTIAIDSDFRNTSSDVDSIESSNASNLKPKMAMAQVIEKKTAIVAKVNTYGYQELPTREQSSAYSTSNSSSAPSEHKVKLHDQKESSSYLPPYETITRSKDSVIDL